ncbi:hypothetical protein JHC09_16745 [Devosia sp. MC532]|uniref:polysaccharide biosynthesis C-terminal domain-containing protein n=1 Tax=Devosia sp. MC532 TaxID=2799788 RepID=UPI0018F2CEE3|nr:polysaccharide biosynthesis C-terminal domain-containing protein [Devosia sp. MC532]MBJ7579522.1 hypothetical protein [Devosia sp. MC532]
MMTAKWRSFSRRLSAGSLSRNGLAALGQSVVGVVSMFLAYRLIIAHAGLERFGVWSLLLAGTALARVGDVSGGGALARFVASAKSETGLQNSRDVVHTVLLSSLFLNAIVGLAIWIGATPLLPMFIEPQYLAEAKTLIPYVAMNIVLGALSIAVTSGIDGAQRADQRAIVISVASLIFLGACWFFVPRLGVVGFAVAQLLQQAVMLVLGWIVLRRYIPLLGWFPYRWRLDVFVETTGYAIKLNAIGLIGLMFEPLAKFAFNHAGGPGLVALYELSSRLVLQVRGLIIAALTPIVPAFASYKGPQDPAFRQVLEKASTLAVIASIGATIATLVALPIVSIVILDRLSTELITLTAALTLGWSLNIFVIPIYFAAQAIGILRWNFLSHTVMALSVVMGVTLVGDVGPWGLVAAIVIGLTTSMLVILFGNVRALAVVSTFKKLRLWWLAAALVNLLLCLVAGLPLVLLR